MKTFCFMSILFLLIKTTQSDEFKKYEEAFKYISSDSVNIKNWMFEYINNDTLPYICVADQIIYISYFGFVQDIIKYECKYKDTVSINVTIVDSLTKLWDSLADFKSYKYVKMMELNKKNCNGFVVIFSKFEKGNKLKAVILPYENGITDYRKYLFDSNRELNYLFYFKKNKIIKVFSGGFVR